MKEGLLHEIELKPHKAPIMHLFPHPYGMPTTNKILGVGQPIREGIPNESRIPHISSKISPIRIQFEAGSK